MSLPVFDRSILDRLTAQAMGHGDTRLVRDLLGDALLSISHCCGELQRAVAARDLGQIRTQAHRVKSVLRQVGALRMGEDAASAERLAHAGDPQCFEAATAALALREDTERAIRDHLGALPP